MNMKSKARGARSKYALRLLIVAMVAVLALGMLVACGAGGSKGATAGDSTTRSLVKTATNEMTLVNWDVSAEDSPLTVSSDDAQYADYIDMLKEITGFNIESLTMQVRVSEIAGAEIGATHENVTDNTYTIQSLDGVVDGKTIKYVEGDFK